MNVFESGRERGAAAVEFALIALVMITMLFLIIEGGRLFMMQAGASTAARDAARTMAISNDAGYALSDAQDVFAPYGALTGANVVITGCPEAPAPGASATAVVTYDAELITGLFAASVPLSGKGEMRCGG